VLHQQIQTLSLHSLEVDHLACRDPTLNGSPQRPELTLQALDPYEQGDGALDAKFKMLEYGSFLGSGNSQSYEDLYFGWTNSFDMNDVASTYYWSGVQPPNNLSLVPDAHLDGIVERLWAADSSSRSAVLKELQIYVADQSYRVTSPVWGNGILARPEVKNVGWRGTNKMYHQIFENAWLDE
jgi:hypothetical protein